MSTTQGHPLVSIIMTVYNGEAFVEESIQSLLNQTYQNLEVIAVNDGSTDGTAGIIEKINDDRIVLLKKPRQGRGRSLNEGIEKAKGKYIAINDADDISLPRRIEKEVDFLETHPDIGMVGSYHYNKSIDSEDLLTAYPIFDKNLRLGLTRGQPFAHQTIMYRQKILEKIKGYSETVPFMFDREIFIRAASITAVANLAIPLVIVRHHPSRFFYYRFSGRRRELMHHRMRMKAVWTLGFPMHKLCAPFLGYMIALLRPESILRVIIPDKARKRIWHWVHGTSLPGRKKI